ncbi:hypothetical protein HMI54_010029 [Coelomomyces lativittatus]|nr:hypothetical protein HMI55_005329 [Coelomomyces lativittatus]KAJ1515135.1 hypothetical protein HMI56_006512 [Coelomomyces lativittatus]KAJ1516291.1 hypothetical protein HMI54_010029 [Coelomomyces lativittatus]
MSKAKHSVEISNPPPRNTSDGIKIQDRSLDFRLWIGVLLFAVDEDLWTSSEVVKRYSNDLHECISSGIRRRFVSVKKSDVIQWTNDKSDLSPACQEAKAYLSSHPRGTGLPDEVMLKVLAEYIQKTLYEHKEVRGNHRSIPNESLTGDFCTLGGKNSKSEKEKRNDINSREGTTRSASKRSKDSARPLTPGSNPVQLSLTTKGKLRNRQIHRLKLPCLDDEPVDGPDLYILLQQFHSLSFLESLLDAEFIPIHSVTVIFDLPNIPTSLDTFHLLKYKFLSAPASTHTIFSNLPYSFKHGVSSSFFDSVAFHYYTLCNEEQVYEHNYLKHAPIRVPSAQILDMETVRKDKSIEKEVVNDLINYLEMFEPDFYKTSFGISESCAEKNTIRSRINCLHRLLDEKTHEWKHEEFAKLAKINPILAENYINQYCLEFLVGHSLNTFLWTERTTDDQLLKRLESILTIHPDAITRFQRRGNKIFLSVYHSERSLNRAVYPLIPFKLSLGDWYELKSIGALETDLNETTYEIDAELLNKMIRVPISTGIFSVDERDIMEKHCFSNITNPNIVCSIYPNQFYATFPSVGSKVFIKSHSKLSSKVIYISSNGWQCYRSKLEDQAKGKKREKKIYDLNIKENSPVEMESKESYFPFIEQENDCFCIQMPFNDTLTTKKPDGHNVQINWRKIYKNGDLWLKEDQEIFFYGHNGLRGYKNLDSTHSQIWTWISPSGEIWSNHQFSTQLKITKHINCSKKSVKYWSEDNVCITLGPDDDTKVVFSDQITIKTHSDGSVIVKMPKVGELRIVQNDFIFTEVMGAQIQFSDELIVNMPHDFILFTSSNHNEIIFPGTRVNLKDGKANTIKNVKSVQKAKTNAFLDNLRPENLVWLCVLQKAPSPSFIFYDSSTIDMLKKMIFRRLSGSPFLIRCELPENKENFTLVSTSIQKGPVFRPFIKFNYMTTFLKKILKEFLMRPPEALDDKNEIEDTNILLMTLKTRLRTPKFKEKPKLIGELIKTPDFRKARERKHFSPTPFYPYLDPECKKFKFTPIPYFKSEQGIMVSQKLKYDPLPILKKTRSLHLPLSFLCSDFKFIQDLPLSSTSTLNYSSPKLLPKENKASRLRLSKNTLNTSSLTSR